MSRRFALIIAAQDYQHAERFRPLKKAVADARAVAALLTGSARFGIPAENLTLLDDKPWHEVQPAVEKFFRNPDLRRDDTLLFYFAGHGERAGFDDQLCLILRDSDPAAITSTSLACDRLGEWMNRSRSKRQLAILDCCYSGDFEGRSSDLFGSNLLATAAEIADDEARFVLAATDKTTIASERDEGNPDSPHALYTGCLLEALNSDAAANESGAITVQSLHKQVRDAVRERSNGRQVPRIIPYAGSDLTLAASPHSPLSAEVLALLADELPNQRLYGVHRMVAAVREKPRCERDARRALETLRTDRDQFVREAAEKAVAELAGVPENAPRGSDFSPTNSPSAAEESRTEVRPTKSGGEPAPRRWPWVLGVLMLAAISAGTWWQFQQQSIVVADELPSQPVEPKETAAEQAAKKAREQAQADEAAKARKLQTLYAALKQRRTARHYTSVPEGGETALQLVEQIEARSPGAEPAASARREMADYYAEGVERALKSRTPDIDGAKDQLARGQRVQPGDSRWSKLKTEIADAKAGETARLAEEARKAEAAAAKRRAEKSRKAAEAAAKKEADRLAEKQAAKPPLPAVQNVHDKSASFVKDLQQRTAVALGMPVRFRDKLTDGSHGPWMMTLPAGIFQMGSPEDEARRASDEGPQHRVSIGKAFALGQTEVTFAEYDRFAEASGRKKPSDLGWGRGSRPVINVSWKDATAYAQWLSQQTGKAYRLPTEAEWEYAARAGTATAFSTGDCISTRQANYDGDVDYNGCGAKGQDRKETVSTGTFPANAWGLQEMHGNVWEWVQDRWHENYSGAPADGSAWESSDGSEARRVLRGGAWGGKPRVLRSANRYGSAPDGALYSVGFRLARTL